MSRESLWVYVLNKFNKLNFFIYVYIEYPGKSAFWVLNSVALSDCILNSVALSDGILNSVALSDCILITYQKGWREYNKK